ncbi:hypothetical protein TCDM_10928 [Trypanosoma cruzi Dm28c]|uniref:Mucin TcMUCII n=1 Tax=Trypanosoma cruzi Dm28c TaxID=1416333 RepID=V5B1N5_TRYCR|nr:hypothetical protein TCDM_10928 [Trypanosoma cruzi Dm28c]
MWINPKKKRIGGSCGKNDDHDDNHNDHRRARATNYDDHPHTVTSSRSRRQPQQLCVGVCPATACRIRGGVHRCGLKRCMRAVRASTQPRGFVRVCCGPM